MIFVDFAFENNFFMFEFVSIGLYKDIYLKIFGGITVIIVQNFYLVTFEKMLILRRIGF